MQRLIYFSTAQLGLETGELERIMSVAVAHNRTRGITGVLLYNGLDFLQVLEGPRAAVEKLYERIRCDPRHAGVATIKEEALAALSYPDWGMKLKEIERGASEGDRLRASEAVADSLINVSRQDIQKMIKAFLSLN